MRCPRRSPLTENCDHKMIIVTFVSSHIMKLSVHYVQKKAITPPHGLLFFFLVTWKGYYSIIKI